MPRGLQLENVAGDLAIDLDIAVLGDAVIA
jgi:hypothetical protein